MNRKNERTSNDDDDDDEEEEKEKEKDDNDDNDDHHHHNDEKNQATSGHTDDNHDSDWPDLDHLISPDEHLNFVHTFNGNVDGDVGDNDGDVVQTSSEPVESSSSPRQHQHHHHHRLPVPIDDPPYNVLGPVNYGPMSEGLMDSVVSEPSRTTTATTTTTTTTTTSTTMIANGFGQQMFSLSQTISHFMLCLGIVGSAFFITGTCLLMMVADHIILAIICILLGCFSLCSSIIYFIVYFLNECTQLIPTKQNKYEIDGDNCGHVQNHGNNHHQPTSDFEQAIDQLHDDETNCLSNMSNEHDHPVQNQTENSTNALAIVDEEQMTSLNPNSYLNVEDLDRVSSSISQRPNQNIRKNQQPTNKQRTTNIFESITFCGHKRGAASSSFTKAKSDSKSELLVNEYENENMLFDADRIGVRRSSSLEILFDQHHNRAAVDGAKDDWKIVMKNNGSNGSNGSNSGPFMIVQFNKDHDI